MSPAPMPSPRGPLSELLVERLADPDGELGPGVGAGDVDALADDDLQLALYLCYELCYRGLEGVADEWEWRPSLVRLRARLERAMLTALFERVGAPAEFTGSVGDEIFALVDADQAPSLSRFIEGRATREHVREFVIHRSAYQLKEADPHTWAIPRLEGPVKSAMVEVQADEYGGGRADRMHSQLFANTMEALDLDPTYGAYVDRIPGTTLATVNLISLFGVNRRWRGALAGHLAGFEISSPGPNGRYAKGLRRLGFDGTALDFYDEHVEADSVHENIAAYDLAGGLARQEPDLAGQILFGVRALLHLDGRFAAELLAAWEAGRSSLLAAPAPMPA
jgi:hypothetical protein